MRWVGSAWSHEVGGVVMGATLDLSGLSGIAPHGVRQCVQVHGTRILGDSDWGQDKKGDGLVSRRCGCALVIRTADCLPVHLYDDSTIATVHAGWRGLRSGILPRALRHFELSSLRAVLGPAICWRHYEVDVDLYGDWLEHEPELENHLHPVRMGSTKRRLDLRGVARMQLERNGVRSAWIESLDRCTFGDTALPSYRRQGDKAARLFNVTLRLES